VLIPDTKIPKAGTTNIEESWCATQSFSKKPSKLQAFHHDASDDITSQENFPFALFFLQRIKYSLVYSRGLEAEKLTTYASKFTAGRPEVLMAEFLPKDFVLQQLSSILLFEIFV